MKIDSIKLSRILALCGAVLAFVMIFINFSSGLSCNAEGTGMMIGKPSLFTLMFGGFEGFKDNTFGLIRNLYAVTGLKVAFAFEIVAVVFFVGSFVAHLLGKGESKIISLVSYVGVLFLLTSVILTFLTKNMTASALLQQLDDQTAQKDMVDIMKNVFANNISLGAGAIVVSVLGILSIGSVIASRVIVKHGNKNA